MSVGSRFKIENKGFFAASIFYLLAGVSFLVGMALTDFPLHLGIVGLFSLITAYALMMRKGWALYFVLVSFFVGTTFAAFIIYGFVLSSYLGLAMVAYLVLTWIATAYVATKRSSLGN